MILKITEKQKKEPHILHSINRLNKTDMKTYNIVFNDNQNSNDKGFTLSLEDAKNYIEKNNGTNESYFADYSGGTVSIICNETGETEYETEIK